MAGVVQEIRINHEGHVEPLVRIPRSFGTKITFSSVKLQTVQRTAVLRGKVINHELISLSGIKMYQATEFIAIPA